MALVTDLQCSNISSNIIKELSKIQGNSEAEVQNKIQDYLQTLKQKYNKNILTKCLAKVIDNVDDMYYNDGTSPWTDFQYDCFIEYLKEKTKLEELGIKKYIVNKNKVGSSVGNSGASVQLPYFMASMNKYKTISEIKNWSRKFKGPYTITAKLDGVSAMYYRGKLYTRGNGVCGRDISYLIPYLKQNMTIGNTLGENYEFGLRGELIIRKSVFDKKYSGSFANSRNLVCGLLNRVYCKENEKFYQNIEFVVYDVYHYNPLQFCNKIKIIKTSGCQMVQWMNNIDSSALNTLEALDNILIDWKKNYDYEIDGIIITNYKPCINSSDSNPDFAFAYKNNIIGVEIKLAIVDEVLWNISKDNYLKHKIKLKNTVTCDGSNIDYVTGFNAKYILQNNIKNGTIIKIGLSGNVIPHIFEIVNNDILPASIWEDLTNSITKKLLENIGDNFETYSWNKTKVDLINTNNDNYGSTIKKNMVFFNSFELKCGLQETTLLNLYKSTGIYKLEDVLALSVEQWKEVDKVGDKKGEKIVSSIKDALHWGKNSNMPEEYFMKWLLGLQCFSRGFGKKKLENHIKYIKRVCGSNFSKIYSLVYFKTLKTIFVDKIDSYKTPQVTEDSIKLFCKGFCEFIKKYTIIQKNITNIELPKIQVLFENIIIDNDNNQISHKGNINKGNIVFSGVRDKEKESHYLNQGYEISDSVNSKTKILIVKDKNAKTTKVKKALELGITIMALNEI